MALARKRQFGIILVYYLEGTESDWFRCVTTHSTPTNVGIETPLNIILKILFNWFNLDMASLVSRTHRTVGEGLSTWKGSIR